MQIAPATSVIPPPAPPIQPAPPGGARREAKQRQAATAKSEEGGKEGVSEARHQGGDLATDSSPDRGSHAMTRNTPHPFTRITHAQQPSAWARTALYGGSITLAALLLALTYTRARPTPRRRHPNHPSPATIEIPTQRTAEPSRGDP